MRRLIAMRRSNRALRIGDFRLLDSDKLLAFMRRTDRVAETTIVVANSTGKTVHDVIPVRDSKLMNWEWLHDELSEAKARINCGLIEVSVPARSAWVLRPVIPDTAEHNPYKRVQ